MSVQRCCKFSDEVCIAMNGLGFELSRFIRAHLHMVILVKDLVVLACTTGMGRNRGEFEYSLQADSLWLPQRVLQNLGFFEHIVLLQQEPQH
jgi:hypothetical protein